MPLNEHIKVLEGFAASHYGDDEAVNKALRLKLDHSLKVLEHAEHLVEGEQITGHLGYLCKLAALYHDIGRFPQFARYQTFNDRESTNHGRQGVLTLRALNLPGELSSNDWRTIRFAIGQHNVKNTRPTLPKHLTTITHLVRDADKLDIYRIMLAHFTSDTPDPAVTFDLDMSLDKYSEEILDTVMAGETGDYSKIRFANDFKLLIIGWMNDFEFKTSFKLLEKREYFQQLFDLLPKNEKIQALAEKTNNFMRYKLNTPS